MESAKAERSGQVGVRVAPDIDQRIAGIEQARRKVKRIGLAGNKTAVHSRYRIPEYDKLNAQGNIRQRRKEEKKE